MDWGLFVSSLSWTVGGIVFAVAVTVGYIWLSERYNDEMETLAGAFVVLLVVVLLTMLVYVGRKEYRANHPLPAEASETK